MMKVIINTAHLRFGGAIQVALSFIRECRHFPMHEYYVWIGPSIRQSLQEENFPSNFHFQYFSFGVIDFKRTFLINHTLQRAEKEIKPDCVITTSGPSYFKSRAPQLIGYNLPLYIYPESPFLQTLSLHGKLRMTMKKYMHFYFFKRDASALVVQTDDVNSRVRRALATENVFTVTNTHSSYYWGWKKYPNKLSEAKTEFFRFVTISSYYRHKNLELIPEVLHELEKKNIRNVEFVLTLKLSDFNTYIAPHPRIRNVGPVKPEECPSLYAECDGVFLPTLAECFSASYPEAMVMEKPIITTDLGFARSICGEAALYFEPKNAKSAVQAILRLIHDPILQKDLVTKGKKQLEKFDTPRERARKYLDLCRQLVDDSENTGS